MTNAPIASTVIAIGLIPVAFLFTHAFLSGKNKWRYHTFTGILAISWDLSMSIGYMIYRTLGGRIEGHSLDISGLILIYFIIHGAVALAVILLEISVFTTGIINRKNNKTNGLHSKLARILFFLWWFAFLSGELFYLITYVI
jgi:hypothetical protein